MDIFVHAFSVFVLHDVEAKRKKKEQTEQNLNKLNYQKASDRRGEEKVDVSMKGGEPRAENSTKTERSKRIEE